LQAVDQRCQRLVSLGRARSYGNGLVGAFFLASSVDLSTIVSNVRILPLICANAGAHWERIEPSVSLAFALVDSLAIKQSAGKASTAPAMSSSYGSA
jgi:hypothetical protein